MTGLLPRATEGPWKVAFALFLLLSASSASATSYFVSKTASSDSNSGLSGSPWLTIQKAANTMVAGDKVTVSAGNYNERVTETTSGTSGNPITYITTGTVITKGFTINASFVVISTFEITNTDDNDTSGVGIFLNGSNDQAINNNIHDIARQGILSESGSNNNTIRGNTIFRAGHAGIWLFGTNHLVESNNISRTIQHPSNWASTPPWIDADGILIEGNGFTLRKNFIHDILGDDPENFDDPHIDAFQIAATGNNILFEQNTINIPASTTWSRCYQFAQIFGNSGQVSNLKFRNNVTYNTCRGLNLNGYTGTQLPGVVVANNTWYNMTDYAMELHEVSSPIVKNNVFHTMAKTYAFIDATATTNIGFNLVYLGTGTTYSNDIVGSNPLFLDIPTRDFRLQSGSPAVDSGTTLTQVTNDKNDVARPQGVAYDRGAYELFVGAAMALVGHWKFDEGTGTTTADSAGSNTGTLVGGPAWVGGIVGGALSFDGVDDQVTFAGLTINNTHTVSAWIFPIPTSDTYASIWSQDGNFGVYYMGTTRLLNSYTGSDHFSSTAITENKWNHIAVVTNAGAITFYVNGVADGTGTGGLGYTANTIGTDPVAEAFKGWISEIRVQNTALTAAEVRAIYDEVRLPELFPPRPAIMRMR